MDNLLVVFTNSLAIFLVLKPNSSMPFSFFCISISLYISSNILYKNNIITLDKIYEYFDSFLLNPVIPNNVEPITFYKSIISTIHGLPEGDRDFEPSILYDIFREYVEDKQNKGFNIVDIYREFIIEHDDSFLGRMLIEILDDISNNRTYCTLCRKEHIQAQK